MWRRRWENWAMKQAREAFLKAKNAVVHDLILSSS
jgi:hypothetical protein